MTRRIWMVCLTGALCLGSAWARSGDDTQSAVKTPEQLRRAEPPSPKATAQELEDQGDKLRAEKAFPDALDYYRAAIKKADAPMLHNKAGITHLQMLRYDEAKKEFERAIRMKPDYPEYHNNLGAAFYGKRKYKSAIKEYQRALALREDSATFHSNLGTAYFSNKEYDQAANSYARALEIDPEVFERRSSSGVEARMVNSQDLAKYHYVIAKMFAVHGDSDRCLVYLRKAVEEGYSQINDVYTDAQFATVRKDPRFAELMAQSKTTALPN